MGIKWPRMGHDKADSRTAPGDAAGCDGVGAALHIIGVNGSIICFCLFPTSPNQSHACCPAPGEHGNTRRSTRLSHAHRTP